MCDALCSRRSIKLDSEEIKVLVEFNPNFTKQGESRLIRGGMQSHRKLKVLKKNLYVFFRILQSPV